MKTQVTKKIANSQLQESTSKAIEKTLSPKKKNNYINNPEFLEHVKEYRKAMFLAEELGKPKPRLPEYIGSCILKIATNLATKRSFMNGLAYRDDMIGEACANCIRYFNNFDPEKSSNPFSYFTQICHHSFVNRIQLEKKHSYLRVKLMIENVALGALADSHDQEGGEYHSLDNMEVGYDAMNDFIKDYEEKNNIGKPKKARKLSLKKQAQQAAPTFF